MISASLVKELREKTGAGMMDCKKALVETNGNMDEAVKWLREKGIAKAEKKSSRIAAEGVCTFAVSGNKATLFEVNSETDFVASNDKFQAYVKECAARVLAGTKGNGDVTEQAQELEKENLVNLIAVIGENIQLRRAVRFEATGTLATYLHLGGKLGVMLEVEGEIPADLKLIDICMHITVYDPLYITSKEIPAERIAQERDVLAASEDVMSKPEAIRPKIIDGKIAKWFKEVCLMDQAWFNDEKTTLGKIAPKMTVKKFVRWKVGQDM